MYLTLYHPFKKYEPSFSHTPTVGKLHNVKPKEKQSLSRSEEQPTTKPIDKAAGAHPT
jgi:hypothetical protein